MSATPYFQKEIGYDRDAELEETEEKEAELAENASDSDEEEKHGYGEEEEEEEVPKEENAMQSGGTKKVKQVQMEAPEALEEGEGDEIYEENLEKFSNQFRTDFIEEFHREIIQPNAEEVSALCKITRDEQGNIIDDLHITYPFVSKYIYTKVIAKRASQLEGGAPPLVPIPEDLLNPRLIAEREFDAKKIPFIIKKTLPNGGSEYWRLSDLECLF